MNCSHIDCDERAHASVAEMNLSGAGQRQPMRQYLCEEHLRLEYGVSSGIGDATIKWTPEFHQDGSMPLRWTSSANAVGTEDLAVRAVVIEYL
jgi:hypothetical protein